MIHPLPEPVRGNDHAWIAKREDHPGSGVALTYLFGTVDGDGEFVRDKLIPKVRRSLNVTVADRVRERAAKANAPTTNGEQEYRWADLLAVMDAFGLWDPTAEFREGAG